MVWPVGLLLDRDNALQERLRVSRTVSLAIVLIGEEVEDIEKPGGMVWPIRLLVDRDDALQERLRLGVATSFLVEFGEAVEPKGKIGVLGAVGLLLDCDGALQER